MLTHQETKGCLFLQSRSTFVSKAMAMTQTAHLFSKALNALHTGHSQRLRQGEDALASYAKVE